MRCLCCGNPLLGRDNEQNGWHARCIKAFFGTQNFPSVDIDNDMLTSIAIRNVSEGITAPGVQKKLSLHLHTERGNIPRLTIVDYPSGFILKPQTDEYEALPEAEYLVMSMAEATGIKTVPFALIRLNNSLSYITKRIDRDGINKLAMEDFCQLDYRLTADKYKGSYERCSNIISSYSDFPGIDMTDFFLRIVFSFAVGNSDMHLKNFSLIENSYQSSTYRLSAAYDLLPVNVILPSDPDQMALTLNGKKRNLRRKDFIVLAQHCGITQKVADKLINVVTSKESIYIQMCEDSYIPESMRESLIQLIHERIASLL